jgi:hypothetical protein
MLDRPRRREIHYLFARNFTNHPWDSGACDKPPLLTPVACEHFVEGEQEATVTDLDPAV